MANLYFNEMYWIKIGQYLSDLKRLQEYIHPCFIFTLVSEFKNGLILMSFIISFHRKLRYSKYNMGWNRLWVHKMTQGENSPINSIQNWWNRLKKTGKTTQYRFFLPQNSSFLKYGHFSRLNSIVSKLLDTFLWHVTFVNIHSTLQSITSISNSKPQID